MTAVPTPQDLANIDDATLERLAAEWRAVAARGEKQAFGMVRALEVERRGRMRDSELQSLEPVEQAQLAVPL